MMGGGMEAQMVNRAAKGDREYTMSPSEIAEAAKIASVSQRTIFNWLESKAITCIKLGRVIRFDRQTFMGELKAFSTPIAGRR
jgi:excisionase family DNA binding protein